jgi:hypothetical protein
LFQVIPDSVSLTRGQSLARGVARHFSSLGWVSIEELAPVRGLRVDVMALGPKDEIWVIECKSNLADFRSDRKWGRYLEWCDRFFWAVDTRFPIDELPKITGLMIGDAYNSEIIRMGPETKMASSRRKGIVHKFAVNAARRLHEIRDTIAGLQ